MHYTTRSKSQHEDEDPRADDGQGDDVVDDSWDEK